MISVQKVLSCLMLGVYNLQDFFKTLELMIWQELCWWLKLLSIQFRNKLRRLKPRLWWVLTTVVRLITWSCIYVLNYNFTEISGWSLLKPEFLSYDWLIQTATHLETGLSELYFLFDVFQMYKLISSKLYWMKALMKCVCYWFDDQTVMNKGREETLARHLVRVLCQEWIFLMNFLPI